jgi:hypothetical protein
VIRTGAALLILCAAGISSVWPSTSAAQSTQPQPKHYRLSFVLTYPQGQQPSETFVLNVPVTQGRPGMAGSSSASGLTGQQEGSVQESLQCTDVQESATGLAANVAFTLDSVGEPIPGSTELRHHNMTFNRQIDLVLGKPTRITEELRVMQLGKGDGGHTAAPGPAPQITVTAIEI